MKEVVICGGDCFTPLGDLNSTWNGMIRGESGLVKRSLDCCTTDYSLGFIPDLEGQYGSARRLQSLIDTLASSLDTKFGRLADDTDIFTATTKGAVDQLFGAERLEQGQPWTLGVELQQAFQVAGRTSVVSGACASGTVAVIQAAMAIAAGTSRFALVLGMDLVAEFILAGFDSLGALSPTTVRPFDANRDGLALGDGGAWMILTSKEVAGEFGVDPLATVAGWGISCDANHITAPCRDGSGLSRAIKQIFAQSDPSIGGINGHGTGTRYNDAMEMKVFAQNFGESVPYCSVKGALGHSLGAAGLVEALLSVKSLQEMVLPPTVGLLEPDPAAARVSGVEPLGLLNPSVISCNSGFGGINSALHLIS